MASKKVEPRDDPSTMSASYETMIPFWTKMDTVLAGTESMRVAGGVYLPKHQHESRLNYANRLKTAVLYNVTEITLNSMVGRPFSDPIVLGEDVPQQIEDLMENINLQGDDLHTFCRSVFNEGFAKGLTHVMVEFPRLPGEGERTLADDRVENLRPYWVDLKPEALFYAVAEIRNGREVLTHVRIMETSVVRDNFAESIVKQIRALTLTEDGVEVQMYQREKEEDTEAWNPKDDPFMMDVDFIPIATFYADREDFMTSKPPLADLCDLNIKHWQSSSDQDNAITAARFPILAASGVPPKPTQDLADQDSEEIVVIGPWNILQAKNPDAKFYYVEHKGLAIAAGETSIDRLEARMAEYGSEFLKKKPGSMTATARALDSAEATSPLQDMTNRFVSFVNTLLGFTAEWLSIEEGGTISMSTDFGPEEINEADLNALMGARKMRDLSGARLREELKRRAVLADDFDEELNETELEDELLNLPRIDIDPQQEEEDDDVVDEEGDDE